MKREQAFIKAFIITVFIISLLSTFLKNEIFTNMTYCLILPTFLMSIIELIIDIRNIAEKKAEDMQVTFERLGKAQQENAELKLELDNNEDNIEEIEKTYKDATESINCATDYTKTKTSLIKLDKILNKVYIFVLILFFSSIIFSNIIIQYLKVIDLNCIALWALLIALLNTYYKDEYATKIVFKAKSYYENKRLKQENNKE